jgi:hypothetical protein
MPRRQRLLLMAALAVAAYVGVAYLVLPPLWTHHEHQRGLAGVPMLTLTADGIPGDPINIGMVGSKSDLVHAMHAAGWSPADPVTLRTAIEIVGSVLLDRSYRDAPVSPLFLDGKRQQLAYEKQAGRSADRRQHVRFWQALDRGTEGRPVWLGAATFDAGIGFSHYTGQVTHRIAPDIDAERDRLRGDLEAAHMVETLYQVSGVGPTLFGRNGEGDPYHTDGEVDVLVLVAEGKPDPAPPMRLADPAIIALKNRIWRQLSD